MNIDMRSGATPDEIELWIRERIAEFVNLTVDSVRPEADFEAFGIDSAKAISLMTELEEWLALPDELPLELLFEAESIREAAQGMARAVAEMAGSDSRFTQPS